MSSHACQCVCGLDLISVPLSAFDLWPASLCSIVHISPVHKDLWSAWTGELICQAVAAGGVGLEEKKARKVKIKLL